MSNLKVCLICLSDEVKMYKYDCCYLKQYYEEIMCTKINTEDNLPKYFCYECATMLSKFHKFREKCYTGRLVLQQMLLKGPITLKAVANIDRESCNLKSPLGIIVVNKNVKTRYMKSKVINENITYANDVEHITEDSISKINHESNYDAGDIEYIIEDNDTMDTSKMKHELNYDAGDLEYIIEDNDAMDTSKMKHVPYYDAGDIEYIIEDNDATDTLQMNLESNYESDDSNRNLTLNNDEVEKVTYNNDPLKISKVALEPKIESDVNFRELNKEIIQINNNDDDNGINSDNGGDDDDDDEESTLVYEIIFDKDLNDISIKDESNTSDILFYIDNESSDNNYYNRMDDSEHNINNAENVIDENVIDENRIDENVVNENMIDENVVDQNVVDENVVVENIYDDDSSLLKIDNSSKSKKKKAGTGISEKNTQTKSARKFEIKKGYNYLDPKHWLKVTLTEEEACREFRAKAEDPKYLAAAYKCTDCLKPFSKEEMLVRHKKLSHCESLGPQECRFCKRRFKFQCLLNQHIARHYNKYHCLRCDLMCPLEYTAVLHSKCHDGEITKCEYCDKEFRHLSTYYTHLRSHRSEHVCTLCGASFVSGIGLRQHIHLKHIINNVDPEQDKSTYCALCDIKFETLEAYDEHLIHSAKHVEGIKNPMEGVIHLKRRPRRRRPNLVRSSISTTCGVCNEMFPSYLSFKKHHTTEHKGIPLPTKELVCEICGLSLKATSLPNHMNTHTRSKLYVCNTCGRSFVSKVGLNTHQLTHSSVKPSKCPLCDKRFKQTSSMNLHYRNVHLNEPYIKKNKRNTSEPTPKMESVVSTQKVQ